MAKLAIAAAGYNLQCAMCGLDEEQTLARARIDFPAGKALAAIEAAVALRKERREQYDSYLASKQLREAANNALLGDKAHLTGKARKRAKDKAKARAHKV